MIFILIVLIIIFSLILIKSSEMVIVAVRRIATETGTKIFTISAIVLALGTSFPELFVGITSAIKGASNLSVGVILGSNIANTALICGLSAFIIGKVVVREDYLKRDVLIALLAGFLPILLALDKSISRIDGLVLLIIYLAYTTGFFRQRYQEIGKHQVSTGFTYRFMKEFRQIESIRAKEFGRLFLGLALLVFSADMVVKFSLNLADYANIPIFLVGLIALAIGTSLPELAFSFRTLEDHEPSMFFGNLLGSTITNSTLIVGLITLISPLNSINFNEYVVAVIAFIVIFLIFWIFVRTKHRLDRWEAFILIVLYIIFLALEFS